MNGRHPTNLCRCAFALIGLAALVIAVTAAVWLGPAGARASNARDPASRPQRSEAVGSARRPRAPTAVGPARPLGSFAMDGVITRAINVRGERAGERVLRRWLLRPLDCVDSTCRRVVLLRGRGASASPLFTVLHLVGPGAYRGSSAFWVGLGCLGRTYRHGSRAPYTIRLWVRGRILIDGVDYATALYGTYVNPSRTDRTPCPLGPASDAAVYTGKLAGRLAGGVPAPTTVPVRPDRDRNHRLSR